MLVSQLSTISPVYHYQPGVKKPYHTPGQASENVEKGKILDGQKWKVKRKKKERSSLLKVVGNGMESLPKNC